jgi:hypothetical protein
MSCTATRVSVPRDELATARKGHALGSIDEAQAGLPRRVVEELEVEQVAEPQVLGGLVGPPGPAVGLAAVVPARVGPLLVIPRVLEDDAVGAGPVHRGARPAGHRADAAVRARLTRGDRREDRVAPRVDRLDAQARDRDEVVPGRAREARGDAHGVGRGRVARVRHAVARGVEEPELARFAVRAVEIAGREARRIGDRDAIEVDRLLALLQVARDVAQRTGAQHELARRQRPRVPAPVRGLVPRLPHRGRRPQHERRDHSRASDSATAQPTLDRCHVDSPSHTQRGGVPAPPPGPRVGPSQRTYRDSDIPIIEF